jgi:hypothetical protein
MMVVGKTVTCSWNNVTGVVMEYTPLSAGLCDVLVESEEGRRCWFASSSLRFADGSRLPSRQAVVREAQEDTQQQLLQIREKLITEWQTPWPGCEFGKAILGQALDKAIAEST